MQTVLQKQSDDLQIVLGSGPINFMQFCLPGRLRLQEDKRKDMPGIFERAYSRIVFAVGVAFLANPPGKPRGAGRFFPPASLKTPETMGGNA